MVCVAIMRAGFTDLLGRGVTAFSDRPGHAVAQVFFEQAECH